MLSQQEIQDFKEILLGLGFNLYQTEKHINKIGLYHDNLLSAKNYIKSLVDKKAWEDFNYNLIHLDDEAKALRLTEIENNRKLKSLIYDEENHVEDLQVYNYKKITYNNKEEIRLYKLPFTTGQHSKKTKTKYILNENGEQVDETTGEIRTQKSISHSLYVSINRTKQKIYDYAFANDWSNGWFFTITFNENRTDRFDYTECYKRINTFLKVVKRNNPDFQYIFIPEQHKNGAWHFHGIGNNCPNLEFVSSGKYALGKILYDKPIDGSKEVFNINERSWKYGFTQCTKIEDTDKICSYITKYITKDLMENTQGKHRYLKSKNLKEPIIYNDFLTDEDMQTTKEIFEDDKIYKDLHKKRYANNNTRQVIDYISFSKP